MRASSWHRSAQPCVPRWRPRPTWPRRPSPTPRCVHLAARHATSRPPPCRPARCRAPCRGPPPQRAGAHRRGQRRGDRPGCRLRHRVAVGGRPARRARRLAGGLPPLGPLGAPSARRALRDRDRAPARGGGARRPRPDRRGAGVGSRAPQSRRVGPGRGVRGLGDPGGRDRRDPGRRWMGHGAHHAPHLRQQDRRPAAYRLDDRPRLHRGLVERPQRRGLRPRALGRQSAKTAREADDTRRASGARPVGPRRVDSIRPVPLVYLGDAPRGAWGCGAAGSASRSHREGQGFESPHLHHQQGPGSTIRALAASMAGATVGP